jgi:hypothetical protein
MNAIVAVICIVLGLTIFSCLGGFVGIFRDREDNNSIFRWLFSILYDALMIIVCLVALGKLS